MIIIAKENTKRFLSAAKQTLVKKNARETLWCLLFRDYAHAARGAAMTGIGFYVTPKRQVYGHDTPSLF